MISKERCENYLAFHNVFEGFQLHTSKVKMKMCNKIFHAQIENSYFQYNTSFKISDVQMDASTEGPVDCT